MPLLAYAYWTDNRQQSANFTLVYLEVHIMKIYQRNICMPTIE